MADIRFRCSAASLLAFACPQNRCKVVIIRGAQSKGGNTTPDQNRLNLFRIWILNGDLGLVARSVMGLFVSDFRLS